MNTNTREESLKIVNRYIAASSGYAALTGPIPGTSIGVVGIQTAMICEMAKVYGYTLSPVEAVGLVASLAGVGMLIRETLSEALTPVPVFGSLVKAGIAGGFCKFLGSAAIEYFEKGTWRNSKSD